jgi:hypothetical protein
MRKTDILLIAGVGFGLPASVQPLQSQIVISQLYGGGGNTGAAYRNDFIELLNAGRDSADLSGWSVQYASATGGNWQITPLSGIMAPGYYFLVQEAKGSGGTIDLPTPEALGTIAMSATSGKVALVARSGALSGVCPADSGIVDLVGYGSATCYEGTGAAPAPGNTVSIARRDGGRTDTQDNQADFETAAPAPRNGTFPPLPIQLVSFSARLDAPIVHLDWATLTEVNNFGFYVQRGEKGSAALADIPGAFVAGGGTTSLPHEYSWVDATPPHLQILYRLRQVDLDGIVHLSPEVSVDATTLGIRSDRPSDSGDLRVWPNPFNPAATIEYALAARSEVELVLWDPLGREVRTLFRGIGDAGLHRAVLDGGERISARYAHREGCSCGESSWSGDEPSGFHRVRSTAPRLHLSARELLPSPSRHQQDSVGAG